MRDEHEIPPEDEGQVSAEDMQAYREAVVEQQMHRAIQLGDPNLLPVDQSEAWWAGHQVGRDSGFDAGYEAGLKAGWDQCNEEIARAQRYATAAARAAMRMPDVPPLDLGHLEGGPFPVCTGCRLGMHEQCWNATHPDDERQCACQHPPTPTTQRDAKEEQ